MSWFVYAIGASVLWGLGYTINQVTLRKFTEIELIFFESLIVAIVFGIYMFFNSQMNTFISKIANYKSLLLICCSTLIYAVASILIFKSIRSSNASLAAIIESCYPAFTVLFGFLIFGKLSISPISMIGFIAIFFGIILIKIYG